MDLTFIIQQLRPQYPELYATEFKNGAVFIWRPLSPYEYKGIRNNPDLETWDQEHQFCNISVVYSIIENRQYKQGTYDFSRGVGGYATLLTDQILTISGFGEKEDDDTVDKMYDEMRQQMEHFENQIPCIIKAAFGDEISFDEIETWSMRKIFYYLSRAEWILSFRESLRGTAAGIPAPEIRAPKGKKVAPRSKEELEAIYNKWENTEWKEISEQEFLRMSKPDSHYDPEADPSIYSKG